MVKLAALLALLAAPAAQAAECRLALLLGLDISSSVDADEDALQRGGLAAALRAPEVEQAFFAHPQPVALAAFEWSGRYNQEPILNWTMVKTPADLRAAADVIGTSQRSYAEFPTALGLALDFAQGMLARAPDCAAQTLDIAGDGTHNEGPDPASVYAAGAWDGITVNGLVIGGSAGGDEAPELARFYAEEVLHGPGAFMVIAEGFGDYTRAMRTKLVRELGGGIVSALPHSEGPRG